MEGYYDMENSEENFENEVEEVNRNLIWPFRKFPSSENQKNIDGQTKDKVQSLTKVNLEVEKCHEGRQ